MAAGKRDVELVFKAKNNAARAIQQVEDALAELDKAQQAVAASAGKMNRETAAGSNLAASATAVDKLTKAYEAAASEADSAEAAIRKGRDQLRETTANYENLVQQVNSAAAALERLEAVEEDQRGQNHDEVVEATAKAHTALTRELRDAEKAMNAQTGTLGRAEEALREIRNTAVAAQIALSEIGKENSAFEAEARAARDFNEELVRANSLMDENKRRRQAAVEVSRLNRSPSGFSTLDANAAETIARNQAQAAQDRLQAARERLEVSRRVNAVAGEGLRLMEREAAETRAAAAAEREREAARKALIRATTVSATRDNAAAEEEQAIRDAREIARIAARERLENARSVNAVAGEGLRLMELEAARAREVNAAERERLAVREKLEKAQTRSARKDAAEFAREAQEQAEADAERIEYYRKLADRRAKVEAARAVRQAGAGRFRGFQQYAQQEGMAQAEAAEARAAQAAEAAALEKNNRLLELSRARHVSAGEAARTFFRAIADIGPAGRAAERGLTGAVRETLNLRRAFAAFYGDSRKALSLMQRLRGQALSLAASFVGVYGAVEQARQVYRAFATVEAAESRLGATFNQDAAAVSREMGYLRNEADRLGVSFDVLADNYTKFLVSARAANFTTDQTRTSFRQITEAARVYKLSNEQVGAALTALSQVAGKGSASLEEFRQQLGDRIPGAVTILARGLGYSAENMDEFYKAVESGAIDAESAITGFGNELERMTSGQLSDALDQVQAKVGRLQNALFERRRTAAEGGFIDGLEVAIDSLTNFLNSDEGIELFEQLGAAVGNLLKLVPALVENIDKLVLAFKGFVAFKTAQVFSGLVGNITAATQASTTFRAAVFRMDRALIQSTTSAQRASLGFRAMRGTMIATAATARAMWTAIGGPIGLAVTVGSFFLVDYFADTATEIDGVNSALGEQERQLETLRGAYAQNAAGVEDWRKALENLTEQEIEANNLRLQNEISREKLAKDSTLGANFLFDDAPQPNSAVGQAFQRQAVAAAAAYGRAETSAADYLQTLLDIAEAENGSMDPTFLADLIKGARRFAELEEAVERGEAMLRIASDAATEADRALLGIPDSAEEVEAAMGKAAKANKDFNEKLDELREMVPELNEQLERLGEKNAIANAFQEAAKLALESEGVADAWERIVKSMGEADAKAAGGGFMALINGLGGAATKILEAMSIAGQAEVARQNEIVEGSVSGNIVDLIIGVESGGNASAKNPNSTATGLGQFIESTWLRMFRQYFAEDAARMDRAEILAQRNDPEISRQMVELLVKENARALQAAGNEVNNANLYLSHFLGSGGANKVLGAAPGTSVESIVGPGVVKANPFLSGKDREALIAWAERKVGISKQEVVIQTALRDKQREQIEDAKEYNEDLTKRLDAEKFIASISDEDLVNREIAKALREEELAAAEAGVTLTAQQRAEIEKVTREKFAQQGLDEARNEALKEAKKLEEDVSLLQDRKSFLTDQREYLAGQGDQAGVARVDDELTSVNEKLEEAIQKALAFWQALGGEEAASAIQGLEQAQVELGRVESKAVTTADEINNSWADKATGAFMTFAENVAGGMPVLQALGQAFAQMASQILLELAQMIIRQAIFNALAGAFGGGGGGVGGIVSGAVNGLFFHSGGIAGQGTGRTGSVSPAAFASAMRYHSGGIAGLKPNEVPAILEKNEEILTTGDSRHRFNGGGKGGGGEAKRPMRIVNALDGASFLQEALASGEGEETFLNYVRSNGPKIKAALG